jgi:hypothetical protein
MRSFHRFDGRVYTVFPPARDLLGDWVVLTVHGSTRNRLGGIKIYPAGNLDAAVQLAVDIIRRRIRHGYLELRNATGDATFEGVGRMANSPSIRQLQQTSPVADARPLLI